MGTRGLCARSALVSRTIVLRNVLFVIQLLEMEFSMTLEQVHRVTQVPIARNVRMHTRTFRPRPQRLQSHVCASLSNGATSPDRPSIFASATSAWLRCITVMRELSAAGFARRLSRTSSAYSGDHISLIRASMSRSNSHPAGCSAHVPFPAFSRYHSVQVCVRVFWKANGR